MNIRETRDLQLKVEEVWNLLNEEKALMVRNNSLRVKTHIMSRQGTAMKAFNKNINRT